MEIFTARPSLEHTEGACASGVKQVSAECGAAESQGKFRLGSPAWPCDQGRQNRRSDRICYLRKGKVGEGHVADGGHTGGCQKPG